MSEHTNPRVRASDEERERVAGVLRNAMSEGRLTLAEGEERMAALYATTYRDELPPLLADLPDDPPPPRREPGRPDWHGLGRSERLRRRPPRAAGLVVAAAAAAAAVLALSTGGSVGLAIVLGIVAILMLKRTVSCAR